MDITKEREIKVFDRGAWELRRDPLVIETTMQIMLNGVELVNIACTPQDTIQIGRAHV